MLVNVGKRVDLRKYTVSNVSSRGAGDAWLPEIEGRCARRTLPKPLALNTVHCMWRDLVQLETLRSDIFAAIWAVQVRAPWAEDGGLLVIDHRGEGKARVVDFVRLHVTG